MRGLALIIRASDNASQVGFGIAGRTRDHIPGELFELVLPSIYCDQYCPTIKNMFEEAKDKSYEYTHITMDDSEFNDLVYQPLLDFFCYVGYGGGNPRLRLSLPVDILTSLLEKEANESY